MVGLLGFQPGCSVWMTVCSAVRAGIGKLGTATPSLCLTLTELLIHCLSQSFTKVCAGMPVTGVLAMLLSKVLSDQAPLTLPVGATTPALVHGEKVRAGS